jgi:two-component system, LytTR family, response regulator
MGDALRVAVVDDEPLAREGIRLLLERDPELRVVGEAGNADEALALLRDGKPQLLFLDVQMPGGDGFEVLTRAEGPLPLVVFVTAYDAHALQAFAVHALDYVLKPFDDERFGQAVQRAKAELRREAAAAIGERMLRGIEALERTRVVVRDRGRVTFLDEDEIDWIEAADYYVELHVGNHTYLHRESMSALEARLDARRFVRIHRKAIVNLRCLREVRREAGGGLVAVLSSGVALPVARSHQAHVRRLSG